MTRRHIRLWAGVVLGALLVGCQTFQPESDIQPQTVSKACLSDAESVGPLGGTLSVGVCTLKIPQGALTGDVWITMEQNTCDQGAVTLGPEGLHFMLPATLQFDASGELDPRSMTVAWWNPSTSQWVDQETLHDGELVSTQISHFSRYVLH